MELVFNKVKNHLFITKFSSNTSILALLCFVFLPASILAQTQSIEMLGTGSVPSPNLGPQTTVTIPFFHNYNNPNDDVATQYFPSLTATITLSNFQYFVSQNTNNDLGDDDNPPAVFGWRFNPEGELADGMADGDDEDMVVTFTALDESIDPDFNEYTIAEMQDFYSSTEPTPNAGINFTENRGAFIGVSFEGITEPYESAARYHVADMTITFNRPVDNPILHFFGLGGFWEYETEIDPEVFDFYINAASVEFDVLTSGLNLEVLSTNPNPNITCATNEVCGGLRVVDDNGTTQIINTWNIPDVIDTEDSEADDSGVASGSIIVQNEGVTTIELRMFARAINNITVAQNNLDDICLPGDGCFIGNEDFGWSGGSGGLPSYNIAHDLFILSISKEVVPDEIDLTVDSCWRMLSSPVTAYNIVDNETDPDSRRALTYNELIGQFWTQGGTTGYDFSGGDPNVLLWPNITGADESNWATVSSLDAPIPHGSGFLMSVFTDDELGVPGGWDKEILVTGSEPPAPVTIDGNTNANGWVLLGNPFKSPISISDFFAENTDFEPTVYIWDRNFSGGIQGGTLDPNTFGSWRTSTTELGDIVDDVIAPFQGFFVQNSGTPQTTVTFTNAMKTTGGQFYGKENTRMNYVRMELSGESLYNSMWVAFSDQGLMTQTLGDAFELQPLSAEYAMFGTRKSDGTIFDIAHLPVPDQDFKIPVALEVTRNGTYTIQATDFNLMLTHDLYFTDLETERSIRIDENFSYTFTINQAEKLFAEGINPCSMDLRKAKTIASNDRFLITSRPMNEQSVLPQQLALNQNYPNPFNPSTRISFELPQQSEVQLVVYDMVGRQVATLLNGTVQAGVHNVNFDASGLSSGVYIYRLQAGGATLTRKLTLVR